MCELNVDQKGNVQKAHVFLIEIHTSYTDTFVNKLIYDVEALVAQHKINDSNWPKRDSDSKWIGIKCAPMRRPLFCWLAYFNQLIGMRVFVCV